jgi:hypothetical protein
MAKITNPSRAELEHEQNEYLKAAIGLQAQIDEMDEESVQSNDGFANLRELLKPPKVDASFYIGHPPSPL